MGQIINKAERLEQNAESTDPLDNLSVRTKNCLMSVGLYTAAAVRAALADGKLDNIPNLGRLSKTEVWRWLDGLS
jgi:DNA-directed RNA polymerase alpha subunit